MEQQTPIPPKSRMKPSEGQKRAIFPSLIWGGGGVHKEAMQLFCGLFDWTFKNFKCTGFLKNMTSVQS